MDDVEIWPDVLQGALVADRLFKRVCVLRQTASTQDAARRMGARPGDVIVAGRQTHGHGRRGRIWADTEAHGIAATFVFPADVPERLMLAAAVAAARTAESLLNRPVGIKWPNDIIIDERKLAGVLVEQAGKRAFIGVGMNITQRRWQPALQDIAVSMAQLGATVMRLEALVALLRQFDRTLTEPDDDLIAGFAQRNTLQDRPTAFRTGGAIVTGTVREINPLKGLRIETDTGEMWLPAQTTSVVKA